MCVCVRRMLTVDIHPDGVDGGRAQPVLGLAVVAPPLVAADPLNPQRLIVLGGRSFAALPV